MAVDDDFRSITEAPFRPASTLRGEAVLREAKLRRPEPSIAAFAVRGAWTGPRSAVHGFPRALLGRPHRRA